MPFVLKLPFFTKRKREPLEETTEEQATPVDEEESIAEEQPSLSVAEVVASLPLPPRFRAGRGLVISAWNLSSPLLAFVCVGMLCFGMWPMAALCAFLLLTVRKLNTLAISLDQTRAALLASDIDKAKIGALAEALEWPHRRVRGVVRVLLLRLLPTLGSGDEALFTRDQRFFLYHQLHWRNAIRNPDLVTAILKALEHVGDAEAIPYLVGLTQMWAITSTRRAIRQSARECLESLEQRTEPEYAIPAWEGAGILAAGDLNADSLEETTPPEIREVSAKVDAQLRRFEEERRKRRPGMRQAFLVASWLIIAPFTACEAIYALRGGQWLLSLLWGVLTALTTQLHRVTLTSRYTYLARQLAELDDVQGVGRLAEVLEWPDPDIRTIAAAALTRLLPQLRASDATLLNARQRACLCRMLKMSNVGAYRQLLIAILAALEQVGDAEAVPYVRNLAATRPYSANQRKVQEAAEQCLPFLEQRAEQARSSQTLLRPAAATSAPYEGLLRPAAKGANTDETLLLRAGPTHEG